MARDEQIHPADRRSGHLQMPAYVASIESNDFFVGRSRSLNVVVFYDLMTAEVAILNRQAIAIAADSAVTATTVSGGHKIFNSANKLFMLSKRHPVAVMVFGNAYFRETPWETIIKEYRRTLGSKKFDYISDYAEDFLRYIQDEPRISGEESQRRYVSYIASNLLKYNVLDKIQSRIKKHFESIKPNPLTESDIKKIVGDECAVFENECKSVPINPRLQSLNKSKFNLSYKSDIERAAKQVFENLPFTAKDVSKIISALFEWLQRTNNSPIQSGVVIAGFGEAQLFPSLKSVYVDGVFLDSLRCLPHEEQTIDENMTASIVPFAQADVVSAFVEGVEPAYRRTLESYLGNLFKNYPTTLLQAIPLEKGTDKSDLETKLREVGEKMFEDFSKKMWQFRQQNHVSPLLTTAAGLPKDELAEVAETLVQLTSFRRRFSQDSETVGGPVDVAVISKGDGFVWVKRKHYFDISKNLHYNRNYNDIS